MTPLPIMSHCFTIIDVIANHHVPYLIIITIKSPIIIMFLCDGYVIIPNFTTFIHIHTYRSLLFSYYHLYYHLNFYL